MTLVGAVAFAVFTLGHPTGHAPTSRPSRDSVRAHELTRAGLDQEAALDLDSALVLYRAARRADSTDVMAEFRYVALRRQRFEYTVLRNEYSASATHWTPRSAYCWTPLVTAAIDARVAYPQVLRADPTGGATPCSAALVVMTMPGPDTASVATRLGFARRALRALPAIPDIWITYATLLAQAGDTAAAEAAWHNGEIAVGHPLLSAQVSLRHLIALAQRGDTVRARALQRTMRAAAMRDGRRGLLVAYLAGMQQLPALRDDDDGGEQQIVDRIVTLSATRGGWAVAATALSDEGKTLIDGGQPLKAVPVLSRAAAIGDSVHVSDLQLMALTLRGRAYTKAGRLADAQKDLRRALIAGESAARAWYRADAFHNIAHLYESEGRWIEATRAIDTFTVLARRMDYGPEITSLLDAGEIRWKAGWHASADLSFRRMVRAIDSTRGDYYYAGEYFERTGNLERARDYYARAVEDVGSDPAGFAGMSRVQTALGHADSAETWARAHDVRIVNWQPLDIPMLPLTLARNGRTAEAMRIAHAWSARQISAGNVEGAALATLQVAQLLLDAGHADSAVIETERVDSIVGALSFPREAIRARVVRGTALVRLGKSAAGIRTLDSALAAAERHPAPDVLVDAHEALGEAFAATGRGDSALHEFNLAALAVEHTTQDIMADLDRAGYRERNLRPFDGALRVLLPLQARRGNIDDLVRWISRRNAAALALEASDSGASLSGGRGREPGVPGLEELQSRLAGNEVLLSYLVLDSTVSAVAVTRTGARAIQLAIDAAGLSARVEAIRRPLITTFSGRLDLVRARYAVGPASELYTALIAPFARELAGKRRLLIAPDGALHSLAFDALVASPPNGTATVGSGAAKAAEPDYRAAQYLIDSFEVEYLPSPAFLRSRAERARAGKLGAMRLLAIGYDAPGSGAELRALREVWSRGRYAALDSSAATESAVKDRMAQFGILHFAVHASADTHDPLASHLELAGDSFDDGYLHTAEIAATRTHAALVVLSACETNGGPIYGGEGAMGIARAFLAGGAHAVVATQWPIGAETVGLMREFYSRLAKGEEPAAALRAAKLMVRRSAGGAHPVHWAGFELVR